MKENDPNLSTVVEAWFVKARGDLWMARTSLEYPDAPTDLIAFHAQQAVEKCLKGLLAARQIEFPKIHDLGRLTELLRPHLPLLPASIDAADELSAFAVMTRYPHEAEGITSQQARSAYELAISIYQDSRELLISWGITIPTP